MLQTSQAQPINLLRLVTVPFSSCSSQFKSLINIFVILVIYSTEPESKTWNFPPFPPPFFPSFLTSAYSIHVF